MMRNHSLAIALLASIGLTPLHAQAGNPVRVILIVADGAGTAHWSLAALASDSLAIRAFPVAGLIDPRGADHLVTGSAASATALAIGERTFFGAVGVGPDSLPRTNVLEAAQERGLATGLVSTTAIIDATPAAFSSHWPVRGDYAEISRQMAWKRVTVMLGGGRSFFEPQRREDGTDFIGEFKSRGAYVESARDLERLDLDTVNTIVGLFAGSDMGSIRDRSPSLPVMMHTALTVLDHDPEGFFLMLENEETDTRAHRNDPAPAITAEMLDLDAAIRIALDYRQQHPETLIVVTSDHETGGATLPPNRLRQPVLTYTTRDHTAALVPLFAVGPGAERFGGFLHNDEVGRLLLEAVRGTLTP